MPRKVKQREPPETKEISEENFTVIAADLSLRRPGLAVFSIKKDKENYKFDCVTYSLDNKKSKECRSEILCEIADWLIEIIKPIETEKYFVREKAFNSRASQTEIGIFEVVGITDMLIYQLHQKEWSEIYPITVKKTVTGNAKADKSQVEKSVKQYLPNNTFANDDESDAAAVGIAFLLQNKIINPPESDNFDES